MENSEETKITLMVVTLAIATMVSLFAAIAPNKQMPYLDTTPVLMIQTLRLILPTEKLTNHFNSMTWATRHTRHQPYLLFQLQTVL